MASLRQHGVALAAGGLALWAGRALVSWLLERARSRALDLDELARAVRQRGYFVHDGFLGPSHAAKICAEIRRMRARDELRPGKLQHGLVANLDAATRGDLIRMFEAGDGEPIEIDPAAYPALAGFFELMDEIRAALAADAELGTAVRGRMERSKFMCACYPGDGARYVRHRDAWPPTPGRKLTLIYYLNSGWKPADGGQLRLWPEPPEAAAADAPAAEPVQLAPILDRLVVFCSWQEHEVQPAHAERLAVTTWFFNARDSALELVADQLKRSRAGVVGDAAGVGDAVPPAR